MQKTSIRPGKSRVRETSAMPFKVERPSIAKARPGDGKIGFVEEPACGKLV